MHEVAAMQGVVSTILEAMRQVGGSRITQVHLKLGASGHLTEEAARQHFAVLAAGTPAQDAALEITWLPAAYQCCSCLYRFERCEPPVQVTCPRCGAAALEVGHHDVCAVSTIDVSFEHGQE